MKEGDIVEYRSETSIVLFKILKMISKNTADLVVTEVRKGTLFRIGEKFPNQGLWSFPPIRKMNRNGANE